MNGQPKVHAQHRIADKLAQLTQQLERIADSLQALVEMERSGKK